MIRRNSRLNIFNIFRRAVLAGHHTGKLGSDSHTVAPERATAVECFSGDVHGALAYLNR